jgi:hypothetical protein
MGAGAGSRVPRTAEDPLEELARLVSQNEPAKPSQAAAAGEPRSTYTAAPRAPQAAERFDAPTYGRPPAAPAFDPRDQRAYGASAQQGYGPSDDFFADLQPVPPAPQRGAHVDAPRVGQADYGYSADEFDTGFDGGFSPRSPFQDHYDDHPNPPAYADDGEMENDMPVRSRSRFLMLGTTVGALALMAGAGVWAYGALTGGPSSSTPPVIKAENTTPVKVVAEAKPIVRAKESYDRVDPNANANVVTSVEEPGEKPAPRQILPGAPMPGTQERVTETASASLATAPEPEQSGNGSRRVRTMIIRPDGTMGAPPEAGPSSSVTALAAPQPPPQMPIQGTGEAAGMSMEPGGNFGILSESAPQAAGGPDSVPMPMPRPLSASAEPSAPMMAPAPQQPDPFARIEAAPPPPQARAATQVPAPSAGGPPSSPQPQVQMYNKRQLKPVGGAPKSSAVPTQQYTAAGMPAAPARPAEPVPLAPQPAPVVQQPTQIAPRAVATSPVTTQSIRPTQVAMASPAAPAAAAPVRTAAVSGPQVATVTSSGGGAFGVQLTAQRTEAEAVAAFNAIKQRNPSVLGSYNPTVARADLGPDRGIFYRAMVPASNQSDASNLCIQFKAAGVDCIVQRR